MTEQFTELEDLPFTDPNSFNETQTDTNSISRGELDNGNRKRKLMKKAPDAPKRFKSAYIYFVTEKMDDVKKNFPEDTKVRQI
jgi:hypothetical protein